MAQSALRRIIGNPLETEAQRMAQAIPTPVNRNFVRRYLNPDAFPVIDNPDGSVSTHRMSSAETDGQYVAYPTIVQALSGQLERLGEEDAFRYAMENNEYLAFPSEAAAQQYAEGGYKQWMPAPPDPQREGMGQSALRNISPTWWKDIKPQAPQKPVGQQMSDVLGGMALATAPIPVVGDVAGAVSDAAMYAAYPEERTMLNAGMSLAGLVPFVPGAAVVRAAEGALDMSQAARMQRAGEQGFDVNTPVYHGTAVDFKAFDPDRSFGSQFWSTTDRSAVEAGEVGAAGRGVIKEMFQRIKNPAGWAEYDKYSTGELIAKGYDGLALPDADGQITYVAFDPSQYRDVKASFDPSKRGSANLMAGAAGATIGLSALRNINQQEEK